MGQWMDNPHLGATPGAETVPLSSLTDTVLAYQADPNRHRDERHQFVKDNILLNTNATENIARVVEGVI